MCAAAGCDQHPTATCYNDASAASVARMERQRNPGLSNTLLSADTPYKIYTRSQHVIPSLTMADSLLSLPGLSRQSKITAGALFSPAVIMDARNKCGHDMKVWVYENWN